MDANTQKQQINDPEVIRRLERFPNPNVIWEAFAAGVIDEETTRRLLPDERPSYRQQCVDALIDIFLPLRW